MMETLVILYIVVVAGFLYLASKDTAPDAPGPVMTILVAVVWPLWLAHLIGYGVYILWVEVALPRWRARKISEDEYLTRSTKNAQRLDEAMGEVYGRDKNE